MPVEFESYQGPDSDDGALHLTEGTNAYRILEFLASHPNQGFTPKEIAEKTDIPRGSVGTTLSRLYDRDLVRHKQPYWAIGDDDRLAVYGAMIQGVTNATERFGEEEWGDWEATAVDPRTVDEEANATE